jgi:hypothetical protein
MNALDYGRDNRLRLWFLGVDSAWNLDEAVPRRVPAFAELMSQTARILKRALKPTGTTILVVGESQRSNRRLKSDAIVKTAFATEGWRLMDIFSDSVPDIRRSRRECSATSSEQIMVFGRKR